MWKNGLIEKFRLASKFMTSQSANKQLQYTYCQIPQEVKTIKQYNKRNIFLQKSCRKAGRLIPDLYLYFKKAFYEVKASGLHVSFNIF